MCLEFYHNQRICQGTGSYPNPPPGLHRNIRRIPIIVPRNIPYFSIAWAVYSLHDGVNRHAARAPINGDMHDWYIRTQPIAARRKKLLFCGGFFFMLLFYIMQCLAHSNPTIQAGRRQNPVPCQKYIVHIRAHIFFIMSNPVAQQSLCPITIHRQFKCALGRHDAIARIIGVLCRAGTYKEKFTACVCIGIWW